LTKHDVMDYVDDEGAASVAGLAVVAVGAVDADITASPPAGDTVAVDEVMVPTDALPSLFGNGVVVEKAVPDDGDDAAAAFC
jgi:hypothetical protein